MKKSLLIGAVLLTTYLPAMAQTLPNGRHIGPYNKEGNPYQQNTNGVAPGFRNSDGSHVTIDTSPQQGPLRLPAVPTWEKNLPDNGHSTMYNNYVNSLPVTPAQQPETPAPVQAEQPTTNPQYSSRQAVVADARTTLLEIVDILHYDPVPVQKIDYLSWYMNGAQINAKDILKDNVDWSEDIVRHFVADDLVALWNVTMNDAFLRILMPLIFIAALMKATELGMQRLFK